MDKVKVTQKVDMFNRVSLVCDSNIAIINGVPELALSFIAFKDKVLGVKKLMRDVSTDDGGIAEGKEQTWQSLAMSLDSICGGLLAYASKRKDAELAVRAKFSPSAFLLERGTDAVERAQSLIALVREHLPELEGYNITKAKVDAAAALANELDMVNPKPTTARSVGKALRQALFSAVRDTSLLLSDEVDALVKTLRGEEPLFVQEYLNARRLQRTGIRHRQPAQATTEELSKSLDPLNTVEPEAAPKENGVYA